MNTEQVVEMIDAISEGRFYELPVRGEEFAGFNLIFNAENGDAAFHAYSSLPTQLDPRTAREIAAALIAWANYRLGVGPGANALHAIEGALGIMESLKADEVKKNKGAD